LWPRLLHLLAKRNIRLRDPRLQARASKHNAAKLPHGIIDEHTQPLQQPAAAFIGTTTAGGTHRTRCTKICATASKPKALNRHCEQALLIHIDGNSLHHCNNFADASRTRPEDGCQAYLRSTDAPRRPRQRNAARRNELSGLCFSLDAKLPLRHIFLAHDEHFSFT